MALSLPAPSGQYDATNEAVTRRMIENADKTNIKVGLPVRLPRFAKAALPAQSIGAMIYVTDDTGGAIPAFSDGTNWRRVTDRAIIA